MLIALCHIVDAIEIFFSIVVTFLGVVAIAAILTIAIWFIYVHLFPEKKQ